MLNDKAREALKIMLNNGTDSDLNKTLRVMAQCLAVLVKIRLEEDEAIRAAVAKLDHEAEEAASRILSKIGEELP